MENNYIEKLIKNKDKEKLLKENNSIKDILFDYHKELLFELTTEKRKEKLKKIIKKEEKQLEKIKKELVELLK